jgi:predicted small secreted protein
MKHERRTLRVVILVAAAVASVALSACNTVSGVGKDIQEASDNVKNAIEN